MYFTVFFSKVMLHTYRSLQSCRSILYETEQGQWSRPALVENEMRAALPKRRHPLQ